MLLRIDVVRYVACSEQDGPMASQTAAVIDNRSVKSAENEVHIDRPNHNAGKKIEKKMHDVRIDALSC